MKRLSEERARKASGQALGDIQATYSLFQRVLNMTNRAQNIAERRELDATEGVERLGDQLTQKSDVTPANPW